MNFYDKMLELQKIEENKGYIIFVGCGLFLVAIGKDAILLNEVLGLNVSCSKKGICKIGIPASITFEQTYKLEKMGLGYVVYNYKSDTKLFERIYCYDGAPNTEKRKSLKCENCKHYKSQLSFDNIHIFEILKEKEKRKHQNSEKET